jgi:hypothetical protein
MLPRAGFRYFDSEVKAYPSSAATASFKNERRIAALIVRAAPNIGIAPAQGSGQTLIARPDWAGWVSFRAAQCRNQYPGLEHEIHPLVSAIQETAQK